MLDAEQELCVLVLSDVALDRNDANTCYIDIPSIYIVSLGNRVHDSSFNRVAVNDFNLGESNALLEARGSADARHHHQFDKLLGLDGKLPTLCFLESVFRRGNTFAGKGLQKLWQ